MIRSLFTLLFCFVLALTSQSMAVARGANVATDQMVLCVGMGTAVVYLDADGNETQAPHVCPDAAFLLVADAKPPVLAAPERILSSSNARLPAPQEAPLISFDRPPLRAPPIAV